MSASRNIDYQGNLFKIDKHGNGHVVAQPYPPIDEAIFPLPYNEDFVNDLGSNSMAIDGSSDGGLSIDNRTFSIVASDDYDTFVKTITVEIGDSGTPTLNKFGALAELTNGVKFTWYTKGQGDYSLHNGIKTNKEFLRLFTDTEGIGTGTDSYLADVSGGSSTKSYLPSLDIAQYYGMPYGIRLRRGSTDRVSFVISDILTGLDIFNAVAGGQRI